MKHFLVDVGEPSDTVYVEINSPSEPDYAELSSTVFIYQFLFILFRILINFDCDRLVMDATALST